MIFVIPLGVNLLCRTDLVVSQPCNSGKCETVLRNIQKATKAYKTQLLSNKNLIFV